MKVSAAEAVEVFVATVLASYLWQPGKALTVKDLAKALGWPEARVRATADHVFYSDRGWSRIVPTTVQVERRDHDYGSVVGHRAATAYVPTPEYLARLLAEAREAQATTEVPATTPPVDTSRDRLVSADRKTTYDADSITFAHLGAQLRARSLSLQIDPLSSEFEISVRRLGAPAETMSVTHGASCVDAIIEAMNDHYADHGA